MRNLTRRFTLQWFAIWIAIAFALSICGLMWSCKIFKFSIFTFGHTPNLKIENLKISPDKK